MGAPYTDCMTTETAPDPVIHDWSDNLEEELVKEGMEPPHAKAFSRAFELGMMRVMSVVSTKQDLAQLKLDFQREIDRLERWLILIGGAAIGMLIALVVRAFS